MQPKRPFEQQQKILKLRATEAVPESSSCNETNLLVGATMVDDNVCHNFDVLRGKGLDAFSELCL